MEGKIRLTLPGDICPPPVRRLMDTFASAGERAYLVGGCVRDALMGLPPHDWDMAVTTAPARTQALCQAAGYRTLPTGLAHGTVTVLLPGSGRDSRPEPVECTTCRTEGGYSDGRHPDFVTFTGRIQDDLSRRDFTVNAMAATPSPDGRLDVLDLFGGAADLERHILRCVGDPAARLTEDALRILRAVRFAVKLGFEPDPALAAAIPAAAPGLSRISRERICAEFGQILCSPAPERGVGLLWDWGLLGYILPRSLGRAQAAGTTAPPPTTGRLSDLPPELSLRLACLLWDSTLDNTLLNIPLCNSTEPDSLSDNVRPDNALADSTLADKARLNNALADLEGLRLPGQVISQVMLCLSDRTHAPVTPSPEAARRLRHRLGPMALPSLAIRAARGEDTALLARLVRESEARGDCVSLSGLAVHGRDLAAAGIPAGRDMGCILNSLLELVLTAPEKNTPPTLIEEARRRVQ
jgi:tRNA nucleotidyltransferase (CCA-adding enzyme)